MRKLISIVLTAVMAVASVLAFTGCSGNAGGEAASSFKVGAIYINSKNDTAGYTYAHHKGITEAMKQCGLDPEKDLYIVDNVPEDDEKVSQAIDQLAGDGCNIIFGISFGYLNAFDEAAKKPEYADIVFSHATGYLSNDSNFNNYVWDNTMTYTDQWGDHRLTAMLGTSLRQESYDGLWGTAQNVPEGQDSWKYLSLGDKEGITLGDGGFRYRALSYFARFNYNYADKYLLMVTLREDGSSKYNEPWGFFPSVGAAWVITNEDFMKDQDLFQYLKLRASWGKLGNDKIAASAGYAASATARAVFGTNNALDGYINGSTFSWLSWETVNETNIGLNFTTANNHLTGDIDWYYRLTSDAVISPARPMQNTTVAGNWAASHQGLQLSDRCQPRLAAQ